MKKIDLKLLVNTYYDMQAMRIITTSRIKKKKDGTRQAIVSNFEMSKEAEEYFDMTIDNFDTIIKGIENQIKGALKDYKVYNEWLKGVKGVGPMMSAVLLSSFDIHKATTVSKMWAFAGLSPGQSYGRVVMTMAQAKKKGAKIVGTIIGKDGKEKAIVQTDTLVRQDKKTKGFLCPYNAWLRTKLIGVLGSSFLRSASPYAKIYYDTRNRLESMDWGEESKNPSGKNKKAGHQNRYATRKMVKHFLIDFYVAWRTLEGLPVREPYAEEYLGKKHSA